MSSWDCVCEVMSSLPGTELDADSDHPAWRVKGAVLARRNPMMPLPGEEAIRAAHGELIAVRLFDRSGQERYTQHASADLVILPGRSRRGSPCVAGSGFPGLAAGAEISGISSVGRPSQGLRRPSGCWRRYGASQTRLLAPTYHRPTASGRRPGRSVLYG